MGQQLDPRRIESSGRHPAHPLARCTDDQDGQALTTVGAKITTPAFCAGVVPY